MARMMTPRGRSVAPNPSATSPGIRPPSRSQGLDEEGVALAATAAEGRRAQAAAAALELVEDGEREAGARHADRVAEGDGPTVDVDDVVGDAEIVHRRQPDGGERLVDLEQVDVADRLAGRLEGEVDRPRRLREQ